MQRYDTILFDADGTLFDFLRSEREALILACGKFGIELSESDIGEYSAINDSLWKALERKEIDKESLRVKRFEMFCSIRGYNCDYEKLAVEYTDMLSSQHFLLEGAEDIVKRLYEKCRLYIITNGIEYVQKKRFSLSPIEKYFREVFISEVVGFEKPDVRYFKYVEERIPDYDVSKTLVVGDSMTSDMKGGIDAGIDCCYFTPEGREIPEGSPIKYRIRELGELWNIVMGE
ncbi:MAG: YjjG family noncanonical pyrimidine nucleotidase [Clostridia bacterium]|nr:YjjG family noncanonical pyrimidine nucleotidase [Clostridia bacterium]